jgi:hypothetical protein
MSRPVNALIFVCLTVALVSFAFALNSRNAARDAALIHTGERDQLTILRVGAEDSLAAVMERYTAQGLALESLSEAVDAARATARSEGRKASALADTLVSRVEAVAGDSTAVVALVDSIVVAKDQEIFALEVQLSVVLTENAALWERETLGKEVITGLEATVRALHLELTAANNRGDAWEKAASPGFALKWGSRSGLIAAGVGLAILAR